MNIFKKLFKSHRHQWIIVEMMFPMPTGYAIICSKCRNILFHHWDIGEIRKYWNTLNKGGQQ